MLRVVELRRRRHVPQVAALALMSISFAGCSADTTRFAANPFASSQPAPEATGSVPTGRVESHPLPQSQPAVSAPQTMPAQQVYAAPSSGMSGGGRGLASYTPPAHPIETTGAVGPKSVAATSNWNRDDGAMIIVGTSDTIDSISQRYGVPARDIMKANGLPTPRAIQPGQSLFIPRPQCASGADRRLPQRRRCTLCRRLRSQRASGHALRQCRRDADEHRAEKSYDRGEACRRPTTSRRMRS